MDYLSSYQTLKIASIACQYGVDAIALRDRVIDYWRVSQTKVMISWDEVEQLAMGLATAKLSS
jgi:hypothetical protein